MKTVLIILIILFVAACAPNYEQIKDQVDQKSLVTPETQKPAEVIKPQNDLSIKLIKSEEFYQMGNTFMRKKTEGKFIKVYLELTNTGKTPLRLLDPSYFLVDNEDRIFERVDGDSLYIADGLNFGEQLQPGLNIKGAIVFELPKDAIGLGFVVTQYEEVVAAIPLNAAGETKIIGSDNTLRQKQDEAMDEIYDQSQDQWNEIMEDSQSQWNDMIEKNSAQWEEAINGN